jgi:glycosyltransferase involved in cell wall biosynthesis
MKVSVVIPTKNRPESKECIESLINQTYPIHQLIIVDGSDNNETERLCQRLKREVEFDLIYIKQTKGGLAVARNIGNTLAGGDIVFQLEDDIIVHEDFVKEIVAIFANDKNREIGGVGGSDEKETKGLKKLLNFLYFIFGIIFLRDSWRKGCVTISGHHARLPNKFSYVEWLFNAAYRREVLNEFKYDEKLEVISPFAYYDDLDFSYRVGRKYKLVLNPKAGFVHKSSFTAHSHAGAFETNKVKILNHYYLVKKYRFSKIAFWWSTVGLLLAHLILLVLKPSKNNYAMLAGLMDGIKKIWMG